MVTTGAAELSKCNELQRQKVKFTILLVEQKIWHVPFFFFFLDKLGLNWGALKILDFTKKVLDYKAVSGTFLLFFF